MNYKPLIVRLSKDIRSWIIFFFLLHLSTITLPPLEPASTWRQTDGLMIARNFYERNSNILYPTVDIGGEKSGIVGCEFPLLNYLIYLISVVFGYQSWYGRLINLIVSSFGVFFFYRMIRDHFGEASAFNASVIVLVSIWFTYNRTNIPDTFAASLCLMSLFYGIRYLETRELHLLFLYFGFGVLGCLSKISAASLLSVWAIPFFFGKSPWQSRALLLTCSSIVLACVYVWYFLWVPHLNNDFGLGDHFFMGMPFIDGARLLLENWPDTLKRFYDTPFKYTGFIAFVTGMYFVIRNKQRLQLAVFLIPFTVFLIVVIKAAVGWHIDAYYVIMFIPPMAFIAGWGLTQFSKKRVATIALLVVGIEGIGNQIHIFEIRQPFKRLENLEAVLDMVSHRNDLIAISGSSSGDPTPMYFAHRRGWVFTNDYFSTPDYLDNLRGNGCKYIVFVKEVYDDFSLDLPKVHDSAYFKIYRIQ